jgi:hypothetical protein
MVKSRQARPPPRRCRCGLVEMIVKGDGTVPVSASAQNRCLRRKFGGVGKGTPCHRSTTVQEGGWRTAGLAVLLAGHCHHVDLGQSEPSPAPIPQALACRLLAVVVILATRRTDSSQKEAYV